LAPAETAAREIALMGGPERVLELARQAMLTRRLDRNKALEAHESLGLVFPDEGRRYTLTVRRDLAQVSEGRPLFGDTRRRWR